MSRRDDVEGDRDDDRDVDSLRDYVLKGTKRFIKKSGGGGSSSKKSEPDPFRTFAAAAVGGAGAAFLSQRFRDAGAIVPLGVLLGGLGYAASHLEVAGSFSKDVRNASIGAGLSSLILWVAGHGMLSNEKAAAHEPAQELPASKPTRVASQRGEVESDPYRDLVSR